MSVYPQSRYGGPSSFPPNAYHHPPPPPPPAQFQYSQPPPQPLYFADPNAFRRDYAARLAELTVNSRPIIQSLSMLAQDYSRWADIVAQCLESHIRRVSSGFLLFASTSWDLVVSYRTLSCILVLPQSEKRNINRPSKALCCWCSSRLVHVAFVV